MQRTWLVLAALATAMLGATQASAQLAPTQFAPAPTAAVAPRGPMMQDAAVSPRLEISSEREMAAAAAARRRFGTSQTLMIVGGATLLAGAIIGGDAGTIMMVGGAGIGIYGLYLYLHEPTGANARHVGVGFRFPVGS